MKRIWILGLFLVAALMTSAMAVASASAAPPSIGRCVKVAKGQGRYKDPGCEKGEVTGGTYEWLPGVVKNKFTSTEGKSTFETVGKQKVVCKSDTDVGEYLPPKEDREVIVFTGCELIGVINGKKVKFPCQSAAAPPGVIETTVLRSLLGFIKAPTEVGVSLESLSGAPFAEFECAGIRIAITGSVIARVTPISKMTLTFKEKFKATKGVQSPQNLEGEPKDTLTCAYLGKAEECGFTSTDTVTNEELIEINEVLG